MKGVVTSLLIVNITHTRNASAGCQWDDRSRFIVTLFQFCPSVCLSDTLVICDHTFKPIETILVSLESPKIIVSEKVSFVHIRVTL